jgi:hypothetical protein
MNIHVAEFRISRDVLSILAVILLIVQTSKTDNALDIVAIYNLKLRKT